MRGIIDKIIQFICTVIIGTMVVAVCWQVITRFILKSPSTVTEELLRFMLIWLTMVGAAYAYGRRKHLSITFITKKLSPKLEKYSDILVQLITIATSCIVLLGGGSKVLGAAIGQISPALSVPMQYIYLSVIVFGVLLIFYSIIFIHEDIKDIKNLNSKAVNI